MCVCIRAVLQSRKHGSQVLGAPDVVGEGVRSHAAGCHDGGGAILQAHVPCPHVAESCGYVGFIGLALHDGGMGGCV